MRVKIFNRIIILLCMILLLSGCGQKTNTFPQIEDLSLFGSSVKEAGKLLGINLLDISPTISENSEQLEVYQLPGTWMIGEGEAEVSLHFLTTSTPKGNPMGLEMVTMEFSEGTDLKKLWEYISETWNLKDNPDWDKDERGNVQEFSWMSEPLDAETTEKLEKISEEKGKNLGIYDYFDVKDTFPRLQNSMEDYQSFYHRVGNGKIRHDKVHNLFGFNN